MIFCAHEVWKPMTRSAGNDWFAKRKEVMEVKTLKPVAHVPTYCCN
jgi:hypothetical protein